MVIIISGHQDIASGGNFELATFSQMSADNFIILSDVVESHQEMHSIVPSMS